MTPFNVEEMLLKTDRKDSFVLDFDSHMEKKARKTFRKSVYRAKSTKLTTQELIFGKWSDTSNINANYILQEFSQGKELQFNEQLELELDE